MIKISATLAGSLLSSKLQTESALETELFRLSSTFGSVPVVFSCSPNDDLSSTETFTELRVFCTERGVANNYMPGFHKKYSWLR